MATRTDVPAPREDAAAVEVLVVERGELDRRPSAGTDYRSVARFVLGQLLPEIVGSEGLQKVLRAEKAQEGERFLRAELSAAAWDRYQRGELLLVNAKDGSGLLPTLVDRKRSWKKQVRLRWDQEKVPEPEVRRIDAAQHAATQAALAEIIKKLDEIQGQLDVVIANQRIDWHSMIEAAERHLRTTTASGDMANARGRLWEGISKGLLQVESRTAKLPEPPSGLRGFLPNAPSPVQIAKRLDELQTDVLWILRGLSALKEATPSAKQAEFVREVDQITRRLVPTASRCRALAPMSERRGQRLRFWNSPVLERPQAGAPLVLEVPLAEIAELCLEAGDG